MIKDTKENLETNMHGGNFMTHWGNFIKIAITVVLVLTGMCYAGPNESLEFLAKLLRVIAPVFICVAVCYFGKKILTLIENNQNNKHDEEMAKNIEDHHEKLDLKNQNMHVPIDAKNRKNITRRITDIKMDGGTYYAPISAIND